MSSFTSPQRRKHAAQDMLMTGILAYIQSKETQKLEGEELAEMMELIIDMKIEAIKTAKRMGMDCFPGLFEREN